MTGLAGGGLDRLSAVLDGMAAAGRSVALWWRDDDLEQPGAGLDALLRALGDHGIVPALAAVAGRLRPDAVAALSGCPARLFVHGWQHANHAAPGARKAEFGPERPVELRLREIADGRRRVAALAGDRALPCFVPPWNRLGDDLLDRLGEAGIVALSGFASPNRPPPRASVPRLDTHVDLIDWRGGRDPLSTDAAAAALADRIRATPSGENAESAVDGPIGFLSHHLVTGAAAWEEWRPLLTVLAGHPAVQWLDPAGALVAVGGAAGTGDETRRTG